VVIKALATATSRQKGWRLLKRDEQIQGLRNWPVRGDSLACYRMLLQIQHANVEGVDEISLLSALELSQGDEIATSCIRCHKGTADGTMGFFVAAFVRQTEEEEEWDGFSDEGG
jgi:putative methyltransferase